MTEREIREENSKRLGLIEGDVRQLTVGFNELRREVQTHMSRHRETVLWIIPTVLMLGNLILTVIRW